MYENSTPFFSLHQTEVLKGLKLKNPAEEIKNIFPKKLNKKNIYVIVERPATLENVPSTTPKKEQEDDQEGDQKGYQEGDQKGDREGYQKYDEEDCVPFQGIYLPVRGSPEVKVVDIMNGDVDRFLSCEHTGHSALGGPPTYMISIFYDDFFLFKNLPVNPLATRLMAKHYGNRIIKGPALIVDDYKNLTLDDLRFLINTSSIHRHRGY
ncbi:hypothetical protein BC938DRAFT_472265 [Jimgerdemannia flammicorona]|uniref:Uncharacterized protein n=1 Tax=Jimgerdemannia flammicorona TaxID=994334 RepID=A0A433Q6G5_9FUNG|nr:hypothetical protein BC938DRAFT_472265 [Jimgerdemannia flammicorona]